MFIEYLMNFSRLLVGMSMCNVKAANAENPRCMPSLEIVGEILHT